MAKITYLDEPKITYLDDTEQPRNPVMQEFGDEIIRRGKAAIGGIEAAGSMVTQIPSYIGGALAGVLDPRHGGDLDKMANQIKSYQEAIPHYKPQTEEGKAGMEALGWARDKTGEFAETFEPPLAYQLTAKGTGFDKVTGAVSPEARRTANEVAFDIGTMAIPAGPTLKPRGKTPGTEYAREMARQDSQPKPEPTKPAEPTIVYLDEGSPQGSFNFDLRPLDQTPKPDLQGMMGRVNERMGDVLNQQVRDAGPQMDMFNDQGGMVPGLARSEALQRTQEGLPAPSPELIDGPGMGRPTQTGPGPEQFPFNTAAHADSIPFPLRQEILESPEVKSVIEQYRHAEADMIANGASPAELAQLRQGFGEYMQQFGIQNPMDAVGARRPFYETQARQMPVEKTDPFNLGPKGSWADHSPTPFELASNPLALEPRQQARNVIDRAMHKQKGVIDYKVFAEGFNKAKIALNGFKLTAFANREYKNLPGHLQAYVKENTAILGSLPEGTWSPEMKEALNQSKYKPNSDILRIVAESPDGKPVGILELRQRGKGEFLEADWVTVEPQFQGKGIAKEMYTFARELGNDIRASQAQTHMGKAMWDRFGKDSSARNDYRTVLPRMGRYQEGAIKWKGDPEFKAFKENLPEVYRKHAKELYKEYKKAKESNVEVTQNENAVKAIEELPLNILKDFQDQIKPLDEVKQAFLDSPDLPDSILTTLATNTLSGADFVGRTYNSPMIKWFAAKVRRAVDDATRQIGEVLYNTETGLVPAWQKLDKQTKADWARLTIDNEGVRALSPDELRAEGYSPAVIDFYNQVRTALDKMYEYGNQIRVAQGYKPLPRREGYFPAKFIGEFYVTVSKLNPETGSKEIIGLYASNSLKEVNQFRKQLQDKHQDWDVSRVLEKNRGHNTSGTAHAYGVYSDLMRIVESGSADAAALSRIIQEFQQQQTRKTAGFYQHEKFKKGIKGSSGRNEFRDAQRNADDMMTALQSYAHQIFEYGEFVKAGKELRRILDKNEFPNKEVTQDYLQWYFDQARGVDGQFAALQKDLIDFLAHQLGTSGANFRMVGGAARSFLTWNLLSGWNARFIMQQVLQPNQFLAQNLASLRAKGVNFTQKEMITAWMKGVSDATNWTRTSGDTRAAIEWGAKNHVFDQSLMHDLSNLVKDSGTSLFNILNGNWVIRKTEQFGRMQVFLTFNELLKNSMPKEARLQAAADLTTSMMTDYRPFEMPAVYRKAGPIGSAASSLARYKHNYFSQLAAQIADFRHSGYDPKLMAPVIITLATTSMMAGLLGFPGREDFDLLFDVLKGADIVDKNVTQMILSEQWGKNFGEFKPYITHGLVSGITGADLSASLGAASVLPNDRSMFPLVSKGKKILESGHDAITTRTKQKGLEFLKELAPTSGLAQAPIEWAMREGGVVVGKDNQGKVRRPNDITASEWMKRFGSLKDLNESKESTIMFELKKDEERHKGRVEKLVERAYEDARSGVNVNQKYAEDMRKLLITPQQLNQAMLEIHKKRMTTERERATGFPPKSLQQMRRYNELNKYKE